MYQLLNNSITSNVKRQKKKLQLTEKTKCTINSRKLAFMSLNTACLGDYMQLYCTIYAFVNQPDIF